MRVNVLHAHDFAVYDRGTAGSPDEIALHDRALQALALLWIISIGIAVYAVPAL